MEENKTKVCSLCKEEHTLDRYYKYKTGKLWAYCKTCHYEKFTKKIKYKWDEENPERRKEIQKKAQKRWIENNRDRWNEIQRKSWRKRKDKENGNKDM